MTGSLEPYAGSVATAEYATLTTDDLVTGEAVALDLPPAGLGIRMASGLIDVVATFALLIGLMIGLIVAAARTDDALAAVASLAAVIVALLVYPTTLETLTRGRSLGKLAFGLRAV